MRTLKHISVCAAMAALMLPAAPAWAQNEDGVFVDPNSPTGKEYEIPADARRNEAAGGGSGGATPGTGSADTGPGGSKLFGVGIKPKGDHSKGTASKSSSPGAGASTNVAGARRASAHAADGSAWGQDLVAAIALAVLLGGSLLGLALRRSNGSPSAIPQR